MRLTQIMAASEAGSQGRPPLHVLGCLLLLALLQPAAGQNPPAIVVQPRDQYVCAGSNATFYIEVTGSQPLTFSWFSNDVAVWYDSGQSNSFFTVTNVQPADHNQQFHVFVSNLDGETQSSIVSLFVPDPGICRQPTDTNAPPGGTIFFSLSSTLGS